MKKLTIFLILIIILSIEISFSQDCPLKMNKTWGGADNDYITNSFINKSGNLIVTGYTESSDTIYQNKGEMDFFVGELTQNGEIVRFATMGGSKSEVLESGFESQDGYYYFCGSSKSMNGDMIKNYGDADITVIKTTLDFNIVWIKSFGGSGRDYGLSVLESNGNVFIAGSSNSNDNDFYNKNRGGIDAFILCLDTSGQINWLRNYGGTNDDYFSHLFVFKNYYYALGSTKSNDGNLTLNNGLNDVWMVKTNVSGDILFSKAFGGSNYDFGRKINVTDKYVIILAETRSNDGDVISQKGANDLWILMLDHDLSLIKSKTFGGSNSDQAIGLFYTDNDKLIIISKTSSVDGDTPQPTSAHSPPNGWLLVLDTLLNVQNNCFFYPETEFDFNPSSIVYDNNNTCFIFGNAHIYKPPEPVIMHDFWLVGLDATSDIPVNEEKDDIRIQLNGKNLIVHSQDHPHGIEYVKVHSVDGKLITVKDGNNLWRVEVPLNVLPKGIYLVEVFTVHRIVKKLCVQE